MSNKSSFQGIKENSIDYTYQIHQGADVQGQKPTASKMPPPPTKKE